MMKAGVLVAFAVGVGGLSLLLLGVEPCIRGLHYAMLLGLGFSLGGMALLMMHHLTGGRWGFALRRVLEAGLAPLPLYAVTCFILLLTEVELREGRGYFASSWMLSRAALCFAIWGGMAGLLRRWSFALGESGDLHMLIRLRAFSGPGLVIYFVTVSIAMTDWVMQLEPGWRSTIFPLILMASQVLLALGGGVLLAPVLAKHLSEADQAIFSGKAWLDLGTLLFAFVIFWAYVAFSQFLIIWAGNLPAEGVWYVRRSAGGWLWLARLIGVSAFFAPAFILLFQSVKRSPKRLAAVAAGVIGSQFLFLYWVLMPSFPAAPLLLPGAVAMGVALGAGAGAFTLAAYREGAALPQNDPRWAREQKQSV